MYNDCVLRVCLHVRVYTCAWMCACVQVCMNVYVWKKCVGIFGSWLINDWEQWFYHIRLSSYFWGFIVTSLAFKFYKLKHSKVLDNMYIRYRYYIWIVYNIMIKIIILYVLLLKIRLLEIWLYHECLTKRYVIIDQEIARYFVHYSECLSNHRHFYATQTIKPFLNSWISRLMFGILANREILIVILLNVPLV